MNLLTQKIFIIAVSIAVTLNVMADVPQRTAKDIERDKGSKGQQVIELANITNGMKVLDIFGGSGYYSELISAKVGSDGLVYLHNNKAYLPFVEKDLEARLKGNRLTNVVRFDREADALALSKGEFDAIFFILGYHDLYYTSKDWKIDKDKLFSDLFPSLKSGGKLVIVDHSAKENSKTTFSQTLHRIEKSYVIEELVSHGFTLEVDSDLLSNPNDDLSKTPFVPEMTRKTDRFVLVFKK